jgi:hypothetical protein
LPGFIPAMNRSNFDAIDDCCRETPIIPMGAGAINRIKSRVISQLMTYHVTPRDKSRQIRSDAPLLIGRSFCFHTGISTINELAYGLLHEWCNGNHGIIAKAKASPA